MDRLHFDVDGLDQIILDLGATEKQVKFALSRAAARTATKLRTMGARGMRDELQLRTISLLRKRLKSMRLRRTNTEGFTLWFGLNAMPVSWFKGSPSQDASGASFRGQRFDGGFVAKSRFKGKRTVFKREPGAARLHITEQQLDIEERSRNLIEDEIFGKASDIFVQNFERDLRARVNYRLGGA
jgi:hypothetical protein